MIKGIKLKYEVTQYGSVLYEYLSWIKTFYSKEKSKWNSIDYENNFVTIFAVLYQWYIYIYEW